MTAKIRARGKRLKAPDHHRRYGILNNSSDEIVRIPGYKKAT